MQSCQFTSACSPSLGFVQLPSELGRAPVAVTSQYSVWLDPELPSSAAGSPYKVSAACLPTNRTLR